MTTDEKRRKVRSDYIASIHSISPSTIGRWKKSSKALGDDWDIARSASIIAGEGMEAVVSTVVEDFMILAQSLLEEIKHGQISMEVKVKHLVSLADAMTKARTEDLGARCCPGCDAAALRVRPSGISTSC